MGDTNVVDEAVKVTVLLFDVFGGCLDGWIIRDIYCDRLNGTFDVRESLGCLFAAIFGNTAANKNMIVTRGENIIFGSLKADALVGTCRVLATELWKATA